MLERRHAHALFQVQYHRVRPLNLDRAQLYVAVLAQVDRDLALVYIEHALPQPYARKRACSVRRFIVHALDHDVFYNHNLAENHARNRAQNQRDKRYRNQHPHSLLSIAAHRTPSIFRRSLRYIYPRNIRAQPGKHILYTLIAPIYYLNIVNRGRALRAQSRDYQRRAAAQVARAYVRAMQPPATAVRSFIHMSAPMRVNCAACAKRDSNTFSTIMDVPRAVHASAMNCACISVGKPGYG